MEKHRATPARLVQTFVGWFFYVIPGHERIFWRA
jgi:hypothetical protein